MKRMKMPTPMAIPAMSLGISQLPAILSLATPQHNGNDTAMVMMMPMTMPTMLPTINFVPKFCESFSSHSQPDMPCEQKPSLHL